MLDCGARNEKKIAEQHEKEKNLQLIAQTIAIGGDSALAELLRRAHNDISHGIIPPFPSVSVYNLGKAEYKARTGTDYVHPKPKGHINAQRFMGRRPSTDSQRTTSSDGTDALDLKTSHP